MPDGDTLILQLPNNEKIRVRLSEIDAPEKRQPFGEESGQMLADLTFKKQIRVESEGLDRYGRTIGQIYLGALHINAEMVGAGGAWCYTKYLRGDWCPPLEDAARTLKTGLWALPADQIMPPWEWRRLDKN